MSQSKIQQLLKMRGDGIPNVLSLPSIGERNVRYFVGPYNDYTEYLRDEATSTYIKVGNGSNDWRLSGNAGTNPAFDFIGTTDNVGVRFRTNNIDRLHLTNTGFLGVGNMLPSTQLDVQKITTASALPNTSGILQSSGHISRFSSDGNNIALDIGTSATQTWLQSLNKTNLSSNAQLLLNPNGGNVGVNKTAPVSSFDVNGSIGSNPTVITGNYTVTATDNTIIVNNGTANITVTLPDPTTCLGREITLKRWINTDTGLVTIASGGAGQIQGAFNTYAPTLLLQSKATYKAVQNGAVTNWVAITDNYQHVVTNVVNSGVPVILDNVKVQLSTSGNRSLQWGSVTGSYQVWGVSTARFPTAAAPSQNTVDTYVNNPTLTTTFAYITPTYSFSAAGDVQEVIFYDTTTNRSYKITCLIGLTYLNNTIRIERL